MSASGSENNVSDQPEEPKAKIGDQEFTKEEFLNALAGGEQGNEPEQESLLFATIQYEEGTSGPLNVAAGLLVEDAEGITIIDPDSGVATSIGDRFIVRIDVQQVEIEDEDDDDDEDDDLKDQVDTSADRFRA